MSDASLFSHMQKAGFLIAQLIWYSNILKLLTIFRDNRCDIFSYFCSMGTCKNVLAIYLLRKINKNFFISSKIYHFFFIQFNVPFKIMSLIRDEPIHRWGETGVPLENHPTHPQAELVLSHVTSAGLEPTPDTAVR